MVTLESHTLAALGSETFTFDKPFMFMRMELKESSAVESRGEEWALDPGGRFWGHYHSWLGHTFWALVSKNFIQNVEPKIFKSKSNVLKKFFCVKYIIHIEEEVTVFSSSSFSFSSPSIIIIIIISKEHPWASHLMLRHQNNYHRPPVIPLPYFFLIRPRPR